MTKEEAEHAAIFTFGPRAECIRVSSIDRSNRFVIALGTYRVSRTESPVPLLLGSGADWESALDAARSTPNGQMAIAEMQKVKDFVNKAINSKSPGEFTEYVREVSTQEAKEKGFNEEQLAALNKKFDEAKQKILDKANNDDDAKRAEAGKED